MSKGKLVNNGYQPKGSKPQSPAGGVKTGIRSVKGGYQPTKGAGGTQNKPPPSKP